METDWITVKGENRGGVQRDREDQDDDGGNSSMFVQELEEGEQERV